MQLVWIVLCHWRLHFQAAHKATSMMSAIVCLFALCSQIDKCRLPSKWVSERLLRWASPKGAMNHFSHPRISSFATPFAWKSPHLVVTYLLLFLHYESLLKCHLLKKKKKCSLLILWNTVYLVLSHLELSFIAPIKYTIYAYLYSGFLKYVSSHKSTYFILIYSSLKTFPSNSK